MTTDRYTKAVLTIIAGALLYIGAMLSGQPASAQGQGATQGSPGTVMDARPQPVVVVGWETRSVRCRSRWRSRCRSRCAARGSAAAGRHHRRQGRRPWDDIRVKVEPSITRLPGAP